MKEVVNDGVSFPNSQNPSCFLTLSGATLRNKNPNWDLYLSPTQNGRPLMPVPRKKLLEIATRYLMRPSDVYAWKIYNKHFWRLQKPFVGTTHCQACSRPPSCGQAGALPHIPCVITRLSQKESSCSWAWPKSLGKTPVDIWPGPGATNLRLPFFRNRKKWGWLLGLVAFAGGPLREVLKGHLPQRPTLPDLCPPILTRPPLWTRSHQDPCDLVWVNKGLYVSQVYLFIYFVAPVYENTFSTE